MLVGLSLGELIWAFFAIEASPPGANHPLVFVFGEQKLAQLPVEGVMGCAAIVGTMYWGCTAVVIGLLTYRRWKISLTDATRVFLPWTSFWTLAHIGAIYWAATSMSHPT